MAEIGVTGTRFRDGGEPLRSYVGRLASPVAWTTGDGLYERLLAAGWGDGHALQRASSGEVGLFCSENLSGGDDRDRLSAVPDDANAIRCQFDETPAPALVFNDQAAPGALVSWAWSQLKALDAFLAVVSETKSRDEGEPDIAAAVRTVLVPVINALEFSEWRAYALEEESPAIRVPQPQGGVAGKKPKKPKKARG